MSLIALIHVKNIEERQLKEFQERSLEGIERRIKKLHTFDSIQWVYIYTSLAPGNRTMTVSYCHVDASTCSQ